VNVATDQQAAIDVLVTVYNGERFIGQMIESVLDQAFSDWRLIIVDDLSTDQSEEIIQSYIDRDPRILLLKGEHQGVAAAANIGLKAATAPLVARLDADDVCVPERLQVQHDFMQQHPDVLAVGSYAYLIDANNKRLRRRTAPTEWATIEETLKTRNCMCHPSSMIRTSALQKIGGYRSKFRNSLDYDLWLRVSEIGKIENIPQDLLLYRRHSSQISASNNAHRQTLYSVGAITDYFLRKYRPADSETLFNEESPDDIANKLVSLYESEVSSSDRHCLNRHAIRFLRRVNKLSKNSEKALRDTIRPHLTLHQRTKLWLYDRIKPTHSNV